MFLKNTEQIFEFEGFAAIEHTSPRASPLTSCEILLSQNARLQFQVNYYNRKKVTLPNN